MTALQFTESGVEKRGELGLFCREKRRRVEKGERVSERVRTSDGRGSRWRRDDSERDGGWEGELGGENGLPKSKGKHDRPFGLVGWAVCVCVVSWAQTTSLNSLDLVCIP